MKTSIKKKFKQTLAMLFAVAMVFTSIPQTAYAAEVNDVEATVEETTEAEVVETTVDEVEIEEGVDLAANGDSWEVTFKNDGNVTVSGNEIATEGTDYTFTAVAKEGFENVTVAAYTTASYADENVADVPVEVAGPAEDAYTIAGAAITEAITVVVSATAKTPQITYHNVTENVAEGATIGYVDDCVAEGKIATGADLKFTVAATDEAKEVESVKYTMGDTVDKSLEADANGVYTIAAVSADVTIAVTLKDKEQALPEVSTYEVSFKSDEGASVTDITVDDVAVELTEEGKLPSVSANCIVKFKVAPLETHKVKSVTAKVGEAEAVEVNANEGVYSVNVTAAVEIAVATEAYNKVTFAVAGDADSYTATVSGNEAPVYEIGDVYYTDEASVQFAFKAAAGYKIDKVEVNGEAQTENDAPKTAVELSFAEVKDYTVKVTTSPVASEVDAKVIFANESDYMTYVVETGEKVEKAAGKSNTYNVLAGADYLKFTVNATGNYQPKVILGKAELSFEKGTPKSGKTPYTFKVRANALEAENIITIEHELEEKAVTVTYKADEVIFGNANINGVKTEINASEPVDGMITATFAVPYGATITMTAGARENCKLVSAETKVGNGKTKKEAVKNNQTTFSVKATDDANTVITSEKLYSVYVQTPDETEIVPVKGIYNVEWLNNGVTAEIKVRFGEFFTNMQTIKKVELKDSKNSAIGSTLVIDQEQNTKALLTVSGNDVGKTLVATVTVEDGSENGKTLPAMKFKVAPVASKVTVKGLKNGVLSQAADTYQKYKLTYNAKGAANVYDARIASVSGNAVESVDIVDGKLVVVTSPTVGEKLAKVEIYNTVTGETLAGGVFDVTVAEPAMMKIKPTVKLKSSDDVSLTLTLGAKKVVTPLDGKVYYKVEVTSAETDENIVNAIAKPFYIEKSDDSQEKEIVVNNSAFGSGKAAKYDVKVTLVQTKDGETLTADNAAGKDLFISRQSFEKKNLATKAAAYETKLKLKKGATTVYTGQAATVATAQFSKNTTYTELAFADGPFGPYVDGNQVKVVVPQYARPGKYTIDVYAVAPYGAVPAKASITFNVVKAIENIYVSLPAATVYKQDKKPATIKAMAIFNNGLPDAPKTKKVTWSIVDVDGNPLNNSKITVKNGKVTIAKDYVVSNVEADNRFRVRATAADYKGNDVSAVSGVITIKASTVSLGEVVLAKEVYNADEDTNTYEVIGRSGSVITTEDMAGAKAVVLQKGVVEKDIYPESECIATDVTFSVSNRAVQLYSNGYIDRATKAVKNVKITATTTDGSKKKAVLDKLTINYPEVKDLCLDVDNTVSSNGLNINYSSQANERISMRLYDHRSDDENYIFSGAVNATVKVTKGGKLVHNGSEWNYYEVLPSAKVTEIEVTDKSQKPAVKKTYKLTNDNWQEAAAPTVTVSGNHLYAGYYPETQTVKFAVDSKYAGSTVRVSASDDQYKNDKYRFFCRQLFVPTNDIVTTVSEDGTFKLTWDNPRDEGTTRLDKGNYKLYFTFGHKDADTQEFVAETATTNATVKVENPKVTKSTFRLTPSYKMYVKDGQAVKLTGTGTGIKMDTLEIYCLYNNLMKNGQANNFTEYFKLSDDGTSIELIDNVDVTKITPNDLTATVEYYVEGDSKLNSGCYGMAQIKITLEKTKTAQNYALSNLTVSGNSASKDTVSANTISGNVFAYVNGDVENRADVHEVYIDSEEFDGNATLDGEVYLINKSELEYGSYDVTTYIVTDNNRYEWKIYLLKQEWVNAEEGKAKEDAYAAYQKAIKDYGVKVTVKVNIV